MSARKPGRDGAGAGPPPPPPPAVHARQQCSIKTLTLDGSVFDAPASGRTCGGGPKRPTGQGMARTGGGGKPWARPSHRTAGGVLLDNGDAEAAFIATLRTHYTRNGTAESFAPKFSMSPTKTYSVNGHAGRGGSSGGAAVGAPQGGLAQQEQALWEEREEELMDAQERRFAQLEDALAARESKREAYLVHRLEVTAARKIEEHRRVQEAAARARELAVQRVQQLPAIQKARAAAKPPSPTTAALQKLARRPPSPASPALAAVQQAVGGASSVSALSTLQAGLESGLDAAAPAPGALLLGAGRLAWEGKRQAAAAKCLDHVYRQMEAARAAGTPLLSPLDAAKDATRLRPESGRGVSGAGARPGPLIEPLVEAAAVVAGEGSNAEQAVGLPGSRRASSLGSGASLRDAELADEEVYAMEVPAMAGLDGACQDSQQRSAASRCQSPQPDRSVQAAAQPAVSPTANDNGSAVEAAALLLVVDGTRHGRGEEAEAPQAAELVAEAFLIADQLGSISSLPSASEPQSAGSDAADEECASAGCGSPAGEPVTLPAEAEAGAAPAAGAVTAAAEEAAEAAAALEAVQGHQGEAEVPRPATACAWAVLPAACALEPACGLSAGTDVNSAAAVAEVQVEPAEASLMDVQMPAGVAAVVPLDEAAATGVTGSELDLNEAQSAQEVPAAPGTAMPTAAGCDQEAIAAAEEQPAPATAEQAAGLDATLQLPQAEPVENAASLSAGTAQEAVAEGPASPAIAVAGGPAEPLADAAGQPEEAAATCAVFSAGSGAGKEQLSLPPGEQPANAGLTVGGALLHEKGAATTEMGAAEQLPQSEVGDAPSAATPQPADAAEPTVEQQAVEPAAAEEADGCQLAPGLPAMEHSSSSLLGVPGGDSPAEPAIVAAAVDAGAAPAGQDNGERTASMAAADSAEALGLTQRASAGLLFGGRSVDGAGVEGGGSGAQDGQEEAGQGEISKPADAGSAASGVDHPAEPVSNDNGVSGGGSENQHLADEPKAAQHEGTAASAV